MFSGVANHPWWEGTYDGSMKNQLIAICLFSILLTGCAAPKVESQPEYDAVEMTLYKSCLDASYAEFIKPSYRSEFGSSSMALSKRIAGLCEHLKPVKK